MSADLSVFAREMPEPFYQRGGAVLYRSDCRLVLPLLGRESVDLLVTDPPYGVSWRSGQRREALRRIEGDDDARWVPGALSAAGLCLRRNRHAYVFGSFDLEEFPLRPRAELIWDKMIQGSGDLSSPWGPMHERIAFCLRAADRSRANMSGGGVPARLRHGSVLRYKRPNARQVLRHPTEKPVPLLRRLVESSSLPGELVLDPFAGSGSTLVAALAEGRRAVGIEVDEGYCEVIASRLDELIDWLEAAPRGLL